MTQPVEAPPERPAIADRPTPRSAQPPKLPARSPAAILQVFTSWRMACVLLTGFSSGLPYMLTGATLQAWLASQKVDLGVIGFFAGVSLPYALKFLWSPLMDRFVPYASLGRRRGWMLVSQGMLVCSIAVMGLVGVTNPFAIAMIAMLVAFFSASQDIAIDAFRTEILRPSELGAGAGLYILGYRLGILGSGAMALILADYMSWQVVYLLMAGGMSIGIVTTLLAPEPGGGIKRPQTMRDAIVLPFTEFLKRRGAIEMLLFILIYKFDAAMVASMMTPFMLAIKFSKSEIGAVMQGLGMIATVGGAMIGGVVITAVGVKKSLWTFGLLQGLAGISFTMLALVGKDYGLMVCAIVAENLCAGMATSAFMGFMMAICNRKFAATQLSLLTSLMALGRMLAGMGSGELAKAIDWPSFFMASVVIAVPGLLLLLRYDKWQVTAPPDPAAEQTSA